LSWGPLLRFLSLSRGWFTVLLAVDVEPLGVNIVVDFGFREFVGFVVVERVRILVPGIGCESEEGTFFSVFKTLHYNYIVLFGTIHSCY